MKMKKWIILVVVAVLVVAGFSSWKVISSQASSGTDLQIGTVELGTLSSTLDSSGTARSGQSATIKWQTSGKVEEITLQQGDLVEEDQLLAALDPNSLDTDTITARQTLIDAQQKLEDLKSSTLQAAKALQAMEDAQKALDSLKQTAAEDSSQAQLALANAQEALKEAQQTRSAMNYPHSSDELVVEKAQTDYLLAKAAYKEAFKEYSKYAKKNLTNSDRVRALTNLLAARDKMDTALSTYNWYLMNYTGIEIAQADGDVAVSQASLESAQAAYERLKSGATQGAIAVAEATLADAQREYERVKDGPTEADLEAAQAAVDAAQATLDYANLQAPFSGTITELDVKTGDLVEAGETAFRIDDLSNVYIDLQVSEVDLASLKLGQAVTLEFDAIADKQYSGEVTEIGMVGTVSNGVVNYPVTVKVTNVDADIRPGMTASVSITTETVDNVLLVPNKAIKTSSGQKSVTVMFEGQPISVPVAVGITNGTYTQVTSEQLKEGDVVVLSGTTSTASGAQNNRNFNGPVFIEGGPGRLP
jgi:HlyD family secretion protein